jgi:hypothetical protein
MRKRNLRWIAFLMLLAIAPSAHAKSTSSSAKTKSAKSLSQLFTRIWRVESAPSKPAQGSLYIFMANGTLLETSCTETYRIATWTIDQRSPMMLRVVEDGRSAFTAAIKELTDSTLRIQKRLAHGNETQDVTLKAVKKEFVCPDLR